MATLTIPADLTARLEAISRSPYNSDSLADAEREYLALYLEWMAATVRERPVREVQLETGFDAERDRSARVQTPTRLAVDVRFG